MANDERKCCLVTGGAGGIGRALVDVFQNAGYRVIATDQIESPDDLACDCYVQADLARFVEDQTYAESVASKLRESIATRQLHALINNAAIQILGGADSLTRTDWRKTLNVNLVAPFLLTQTFLPELEHAHGAVVNISSIHARLTKANFVSYATSKAALSGMTRALAVDLGPRVRVNAIEPAAIETEMLKAGFAGKADQYAALLDCHPVRQVGTPAQVAQAALMMVSGDLPFMDGACVDLSGAISGRLHDPG